MELRNQIRLIAFELGSKNGYYSSEQVIFELRQKQPELIAKDSRRLEDIALRRILNDVESRQSSLFNKDQIDMFSELGGLPLSIQAEIESLPDGTTKKARRLLQHAPISLIRQHLAKARTRNSKSRLDIIEEMLTEYAPYITSEDDTLTDAMRRRREQKGT